ncbi:MAG TPA: GAF and ANTAR domain-containing protein [Ilumatobacteraceae bacterium]|jgi:GAF domain-containing protein|nr:GAF and ANTAR domain-containing protein [Ilumatobacteraceae bacterium]
MDQPDSELTSTLTLLALAVLTERSLTDDLQRLLKVAMHQFESSSGGSIALLVDGKPSTVAVTDHVALELDLAQYHNDEGPCLTALGGRSVRVAHLPEDERFPHFAIGAADQRIHSVLSTPIHYNDQVIGTLNLYSRQTDAFDDNDEAIALLVAVQAANAIAKSELLTSATSVRDQLQAQYDDRTLISRAQGVLMAVQECSTAQALRLMHSAANENMESLVVIATRILDAVQSDSPPAS